MKSLLIFGISFAICCYNISPIHSQGFFFPGDDLTEGDGKDETDSEEEVQQASQTETRKIGEGNEHYQTSPTNLK